MIRAADAGRDAIVQSLLLHGADVHAPTKYGDTALIFASQFCQASTVQLLIECGAKVDHVNDRGETALLCAADRAKADVIEVLVNAGANPNHQKWDGNTALMCAARRSCDVVREIVKAGADLDLTNHSGNTALIIGATWGSFDTVVCLVEAGAHIEIKNNEGETAVMSAARCNRNRAVVYLLRSGARVDLVHNDTTLNTVLMYACRFCLLDTIIFLLNSKTPEELLINHVNRSGHSALTYACVSDMFEAVRLLLAANACVNVRTNTDDTPLTLAAKHASLAMVRILVEAGAHVNASNKEGCTPLHNAVRRDKPDIIEYLLLKGAHVTSEIHLATLLGNRKFIQLLMQNGAAPSVQNIQSLFPRCDLQSSSSLRNSLNAMSFEHMPCYWGQQSPLCLALQQGFADVARFFIHNWFLSWFDVASLPFLLEIRHNLEERNLKDCIHILDALCCQPWRLRTLSFIATCERVGYGPDRAENIRRTRLPDSFQRKLQFRDSSAYVSEEDWKQLDVCV